MSCQSHAPVAISTIFNGSPMDVVLGAGATDLFFCNFLNQVDAVFGIWVQLLCCDRKFQRLKDLRWKRWSVQLPWWKKQWMPVSPSPRSHLSSKVCSRAGFFESSWKSNWIGIDWAFATYHHHGSWGRSWLTSRLRRLSSPWQPSANHPSWWGWS